MRKYINFRFGFNLTEVLLTIGIIGIIASITIPIIVHNYDEKERYSKVNKMYSILSGALERSVANGEDYSYYTIKNDSPGMLDFYNTYLKKYLTVMKVCENQTEGCWNSNTTKTLKGTDFKYNHPGVSIGEGTMALVLNDGTFVQLDAYGDANDFKTFFGVTKGSEPGMTIIFDINGEKNPNTIGKDIFAVLFLPEHGIVPAFYGASDSEIASDCSKEGIGFACIQNYLQGEVTGDIPE